jgi:peptidoglycan/xylan/chitin deacetylase (PgdA/CDA1 family)
VTPGVLNILKQNGVEACFFVIGGKANDLPGLIDRMDQEGHIIGGHSYTHHFLFDLMGRNRIRGELELSEEVIYKIIGKKMNFFRPPYGVTNPVIARVVRAMQLQSIGWSLKSRDTVVSDGEELLRRLKEKVRPGDLILFHDNRQVVLQVLGPFVAFLKENRYTIVRPDKLINLKAYEDSV